MGDWRVAEAVDGRVLVFLKILPIREEMGDVSLLECVAVAPADLGLRRDRAGASVFTVGIAVAGGDS